MRIFYALCFVGALALPLTAHAQEHHHPPQDVQLHEKFTALGTCLISPRKAVAASRIATRQRSNTSERRCSLGHGKTESGSSCPRRRSSVTATIQTAAITSACPRRVTHRQARCSASRLVEPFNTADWPMQAQVLSGEQPSPAHGFTRQEVQRGTWCPRVCLNQPVRHLSAHR
jgi:hypothetical protein